MFGLSRWQVQGSRPSLPGSEEVHSGGLLRLDDLYRVWHSFRLAVAAGALIAGLVLGVVWQWPGAFVAAALATLALVDAVLRRQAPPGSPMPSLLMDVTLIGAAMMVVGLEPSGVGAPLIYMLAVPVLLLPWRRALPVMAYALGLSAMAFAGIAVMSVPVQVVDGVVTAITFVIFGGHTLALLAVVAFGLERARRAGELRLTWERALARCGEALLSTMEEGAIDVAIEALLEAVPTQNIFVDENIDSPVLGLCARVTHEVVRPGFADIVSEEIWAEPDLGPAMIHTTLAYADLPTAYAALSRGEASFVVTRQLEGREHEIYAEDGCKSELNIPIIVDAEWVGSIGFADYVTERSWSDEHLEALHTAAAMVGAFWERKRAYERLEESIRSRDEFLASISHEIRTPLTGVLGYSSLLSEEIPNLSGEAADYTLLIAQEAQEVADLVEDLLVVARPDISSLTVIPESIELRETADKVLNAFVAKTAHRIGIDGTNVVAWADPTRLRQIIRCLISNAIRYGGDRIDVRIRGGNHRATMTVTDNGSGVPAEDEQHIFEAFHRAHSRRGQPQAIGLGLYIARHLATAMGGDLTYHREHRLTTFELDLPTRPSTDTAPVLTPQVSELVTR
jgi:two-component sensor histidine kinase